MKLHQRTLLIVGITLTSLIGVLYGVSAGILLNSYATLEDTAIRATVRRVLDNFADNTAKLNFTVRDWAERDDTYQFIQDANQDYIQTNLNDATIARLHVNLLLLTDNTGKIVFGKAFNSQQAKSTTISAEVRSQLAVNQRLFQHSSSSNLVGILLLPEGPMLVASRPILTGEGTGPIRGALLMGRYLNTAEVNRLADLTHVNLTLYSISEQRLPPDVLAARTALLNQGQQPTDTSIRVQPLDADWVAGYSLLPDIYGQPAVLLRVHLPRDIYQQGKAMMNYVLWALLVLSLVFGVATQLLLKKLVLSRLASLNQGVKYISDSNDLTTRMAIAGADELSQLAGAINQMLTALEQSQQELRQSQEQYQSVINNLKEVIFQIDRMGMWTLLNPAWTEITGFPVEKSLGTSCFSYVYPNDRQRSREIFRQLIEQQQVGDRYEIRYLTKDSNYRWMEVDVRASLATDGQVVGISGTLIDITERKQAEETVRLLQTLTQAINEAPDFQAALEVSLCRLCAATDWNYGEAWVLHPRKRVLELSPVWYSSTAGLEDFRQLSEAYRLPLGTDLPGRVWSSKQAEWIQDMSFQTNAGFLRAHIAVEAGFKAGFAVPIIAKDEVLAVLAFFMFEARSRDRQLVELVSAVATQLGAVIQRKRAEAALQQTEEKYRSIFQNATEGIFQTTPGGYFLSVNPALVRILGYASAEELMTQVTDISQQLYVDPQQRIQLMTVLNNQGKVEAFESLIYRKDRSVIWIAENTRSVKSLEGNLLYYEGTMVDITARKVAEEALRFQQEQTERLLLDILPKPIADRLKLEETIADSFAEVTVLFADIVDFTKFSAHTSPIELVNLLNQIFSIFDHLAERHGLEKIKTIGDAYMAVGGLPIPRPDHAAAIAEMALDMQKALTHFNHESGQNLQLRIGINSGPVVAGVIGLKKFIYDLWGDTVNTASRMESQGLAGTIQVTQTTYEHLCDQYVFEKRGLIPIKGKGDMTTYLLLDRKLS